MVERPLQMERAPVGPQGKRVLVVDDNADGAEMLSELLQLTGHDARTAFDGAAALSVAADFSPQVIFLDIGLPDIDGYEVARRLRADARHGDVVLVALTGWSGEDDKRQTKDAGFDYHLIKPVDGTTVEELLTKL